MPYMTAANGPAEWAMFQQQRRDDQLRNLLNMFMGLKQNQSEQGWKQKEWDFQQKQYSDQLERTRQKDILEQAKEAREAKLAEAQMGEYGAMAEYRKAQAAAEAAKAAQKPFTMSGKSMAAYAGVAGLPPQMIAEIAGNESISGDALYKLMDDIGGAYNAKTGREIKATNSTGKDPGRIPDSQFIVRAITRLKDSKEKYKVAFGESLDQNAKDLSYRYDTGDYVLKHFEGIATRRSLKPREKDVVNAINSMSEKLLEDPYFWIPGEIRAKFKSKGIGGDQMVQMYLAALADSAPTASEEGEGEGEEIID